MRGMLGRERPLRTSFGKPCLPPSGEKRNTWQSAGFLGFLLDISQFSATILALLRAHFDLPAWELWRRPRLKSSLSHLIQVRLELRQFAALLVTSNDGANR